MAIFFKEVRFQYVDEVIQLDTKSIQTRVILSPVEFCPLSMDLGNIVFGTTVLEAMCQSAALLVLSHNNGASFVLAGVNKVRWIKYVDSGTSVLISAKLAPTLSDRGWQANVWASDHSAELVAYAEVLFGQRKK